MCVGGGGGRVQVRGNFHILTSKKKTKQNLRGGLNPLTPPPGSATVLFSLVTANQTKSIPSIIIMIYLYCCIYLSYYDKHHIYNIIIIMI